MNDEVQSEAVARPSRDSDGFSERIGYLLSATNVEAATRRLDLLLEHGGVTVESLPDSHEDNHGRKQVVIDGEPVLFLKTIRDSGRNTALDLFCELVGYHIAARFDAPVAPASVVDHDEHGPALVLPYYERDLRDHGGSTDDLANASRLPRLFAIEVWLENTDDKERHFMLADTDDGPVVRFIDHGHCLLRRHANLSGPDEIASRNVRTSGNVPASTYGVESVDDASRSLDLIADVSDEEIKNFVHWAIRQLDDVDHPEVESFLEDAKMWQDAAAALLRDNRDNIHERADQRITDS